MVNRQSWSKNSSYSKLMQHKLPFLCICFISNNGHGKSYLVADLHCRNDTKPSPSFCCFFSGGQSGNSQFTKLILVQ